MALNKTKMSILGEGVGAEVAAPRPGQHSSLRWHFCCPRTLPAPLAAECSSGKHAVRADSHSLGVLLNGGPVCVLCQLCDLSFARLNTLINSFVFSVRCYVLGEWEGSAESSFPVLNKQAVSFLPPCKANIQLSGEKSNCWDKL